MGSKQSGLDQASAPAVVLEERGAGLARDLAADDAPLEKAATQSSESAGSVSGAMASPATEQGSADARRFELEELEQVKSPALEERLLRLLCRRQPEPLKDVVRVCERRADPRLLVEVLLADVRRAPGPPKNNEPDLYTPVFALWNLAVNRHRLLGRAFARRLRLHFAEKRAAFLEVVEFASTWADVAALELQEVFEALGPPPPLPSDLVELPTVGLGGAPYLPAVSAALIDALACGDAGRRGLLVSWLECSLFGLPLIDDDTFEKICLPLVAALRRLEDPASRVVADAFAARQRSLSA